MKNSSFLVVFEQIAKASAFEKYRILNKFVNFLSNGQQATRFVAPACRSSLSSLRLVVLVNLSLRARARLHAYFYMPETRALSHRGLGSGWMMEAAKPRRRARPGTKRSRPNVWRGVRTAESGSVRGFRSHYSQAIEERGVKGSFVETSTKGRLEAEQDERRLDRTNHVCEAEQDERGSTGRSHDVVYEHGKA